MRCVLPMLLALAACGAGCVLRPQAEAAGPRIELIPLAELLANPEFREDTQRELDGLMAGFAPADVRRTATVALSPAGYLCVLRVTAQRPEGQVFVQSLRVRHNLTGAGRDLGDRLYRLFIYWTDARGETRSPVPLSWKADVAGRRQAGVQTVIEEQNLSVQACRYPYSVPPRGRRMILHTTSEQAAAAWQRVIQKDGAPTGLLLQFNSDLKTNEASFRLSGAGIDVSVANREPAPEPIPPPSPTSQPATAPAALPEDEYEE